MSINNIDMIKNTNADQLNGINKVMQTAQTAKTAAAEKIIAEKAPREDSFVKSPDMKQEETGIYSRESILEQLRDSEEQRVKAFEDTIRSMVAQQGETINLTFRGVGLHVTEEDSAKAAKSIEDGGEYSVNSVTDRIMNMAKALAGDDPTKIDMLKNAVIKGFEGAVGLLGKNSMDEMPDITNKTYESVMKQFDDWKASYNTEVEENVNVDNNEAAAFQAVQAASIEK